MYRSLDILTVVKSRRFESADNVARMEEGRNALKILTGKRTERDP